MHWLMIGFVATLSLDAIAAAEAQTELKLSAKQSLIYRLQHKIGRDRVERDGLVALFLAQGAPYDGGRLH
jgi:hypothetical protein